MREEARRAAAIGMIALAGFILFTVFTGRYRTKPILPELVPVFGAPFGFIFGALEVGFCLFFKARKGLLWMLAVWVVSILLVYLTASLSSDYEGLSIFSRAITGAACASALLLGIGVLKEKL